ncbi:hypothetical protein GYMLUDRAFT_37466 [Collybiopsis luxurians FD-317 M1]|nr:hypothetical protein GYMLUDRAFT_37466 [Collybiopsis luxurians FD-317 M1]
MSANFSPSSSAVSTPTNSNQADFSSYSVPARSQSPISAFAAEPLTWRPPTHWNINANELASSSIVNKSLKRKDRSLEDQEIIAETSARVASRIATDHAAVLSPDIETPFLDTIDAINRLLPYHIFLQPKADLTPPLGDRKGKKKAVGMEDIKETQFALECHRRRRKLQERFRKARIKSGHGSEFNPELISLMQSVLDADRADVATLNAQLRAARSEYDGLERQKQASSSTASAQPSTSAKQSYYSPSTTTNKPSAYYHPYPYAYAPSFSVPQSSIPTSYTSSSAITSASGTPATAAAYQTTAAPARVNAIPVQLPITSIPSLNNLGIIPVPAESLIEGQPPPPAILRGSTSNGTILNLEINVSMLQSSQMSGLAVILNSLMSRPSASAPITTPSTPVVVSAPPTPTLSSTEVSPVPADQ